MLLHPGLQGHCTAACTRASLGSFASHSLLHCFLARFQSETLGTGGGAKEMKVQISRVTCFLHIQDLGLICECLSEILSIDLYLMFSYGQLSTSQKRYVRTYQVTD